MAGIEEQIDKLLSNPESLGKIMEIAKSISGSGVLAETKGEPPKEKGLLDELNISPKLMETVGNAVKGINGNEQRVSLLTAMRPFVREDHRDMLDNAIRAIKIAKAARAVIDGFDK